VCLDDLCNQRKGAMSATRDRLLRDRREQAAGMTVHDWQLKHADTVVQAQKLEYEQACDERSTLIRQALKDGTKAADIARVLGVSRARIAQLKES